MSNDCSDAAVTFNGFHSTYGFTQGCAPRHFHRAALMDVVEIKRHFEVFIRRPGKEVQTAIFRQ